MAVYGEKFIDYLNAKAQEEGKELLFDSIHREELIMSIWLHDVGKLVIPLEIMDKPARFYQNSTVNFYIEWKSCGF